MFTANVFIFLLVYSSRSFLFTRAELFFKTIERLHVSNSVCDVTTKTLDRVRSQENTLLLVNENKHVSINLI